MNADADQKKVRPENDVNLMNNSQVILLVILVAVVASIASALAVLQVVGTSPRDAIVQTVETVREVVTEREVLVQASTTPVRNIVVKEGDLVAQAIEKNKNSSIELYVSSQEGDSLSSQETLVGYGYIVSEHQIISIPDLTDKNTLVARDISMTKRGQQSVTVWQSEEFINAGDPIDFSLSQPRVGQTVVYISGTGQIQRGTVESTSNSSFGFSGNLQEKPFGILVDLNARVVGLWNGDQILSAATVAKEIESISSRPFNPVTDGQTNSGDTSQDDKGVACALFGGVYDDAHNECLDISENQCLTMGGQFNECASPCRNDPEAETCIQSCAVVCAL